MDIPAHLANDPAFWARENRRQQEILEWELTLWQIRNLPETT